MDEQELERLAERYADMIYRIALNDTRSPADAEDILQEVLLALFTSAPSFDSPEHEKRWLIRVTLNKGKNHRRSLLRRATLPLEEADGYTITAEAVAGDQHKLLLAYSVVREDGQPIPENIQFSSWENNLTNGRGGSVTHYWAHDPNDPSRMMFYEVYTAGQSLPRTVKISFAQIFTDFSDQGDHREPIVLAEGPWELSFTRRYPDTTREVSAKGITFTDNTGREYAISSLSISSLGFFVNGTTPRDGKEPELFDLSASATLADGSVVELNDDSLGVSGAEGHPYKFRWQSYYKDGVGITLTSPDDVVSLTLCDTTIPVP